MMIGEARQEYLTNKRTMESDSAANALLPYGPTTGWNVPLGDQHQDECHLRPGLMHASKQADRPTDRERSKQRRLFLKCCKLQWYNRIAWAILCVARSF